MDLTSSAYTSPRKPSRVVPERLRALRKASGMTQRQLAKRLKGFGLNVQQPAVALMERDPDDEEKPSRKASLDEVVALASIFGVPLAHLYDDAYGSERSWVDYQVRQAEKGEEEIRTEMADQAGAQLDRGAQPEGEK